MKPRRTLFGWVLFFTAATLWPSGSLFAKATRSIETTSDAQDGTATYGRQAGYQKVWANAPGAYIEIGTHGGTQADCTSETGGNANNASVAAKLDWNADGTYDYISFSPGPGGNTASPCTAANYGYGTSVGFLEWSLASLPSDAHIYNVWIRYHGDFDDAGKTFSIKNLATAQPSSGGTAAQTIIFQAYNGTEFLASTSVVAATNQRFTLNASATSEVQNRVDSATNWFAVGFASMTTDNDFDEDRIRPHDYGTNPVRPTLEVEYASSPVSVTLSTSTLGTTSITWSWNDRNEGFGEELSYQVFDNLNSAKSGVLAADTVSWLENTGLSPNTAYTRYVRASNDAGTANSGTKTVYTLANNPTSGSLLSVSSISANLQWSHNGNPTSTTYILEASSSNTFAWITDSSTVTPGGATPSDWITDGLMPNVTHYFRGWAKNGDGIRSAGAFPAISSVTAAAVPTDSSIPPNIPSATVYPTSATVFWAHGLAGQAKNPVGTLYRVQVALDINFTSLVVNETTAPLSTPNASYTATGLTPGVPHYFRVNAINRNGFETATHYLGNTEPPPAAPSNPIVVSSHTTTTATKLQWGHNSNPVGVMSYIVEVTTEPTGDFNNYISFSSTLTPTVDPATHTMTGLVPNTSHYFRVRARDTTNGNFSSNVDFVDNPPNNHNPEMTFAAAPSGGVVVSTMVFVSSATVRWNVNSNPLSWTEYIVEAFSDPGLTTLVVSSTMTPTVSPATHTFFSGLTPNTSHYFRVRAKHRRSGGGYTSDATAFTNEPGVTWAQPPTGGAWTNDTTNSVSFNWNTGSNPGDTNYIAELYSDSAYTTKINSSTGTANSATFNSLTPNTSYYARVRAKNRKNTPDYTAYDNIDSTSAVRVTDAENPSPTAVTGIWVTSATVTWDPGNNPGDTSYIVEVDTDSLFTGALLKGATVTGTSHAFAAGDLLPNTSHWFRIRAKDRLGFQYANQVFSGTHVTLAQPPTGGAWTNDTTNSVSFNWNTGSNPGDTNYIAELYSDSAYTTKINSSTGTANSATFNSLTPNTSYYARVRAKNRKSTPDYTAYDNIDSTSAVRVTDAENPSPTAVTGIWVTSATVTWDPGNNPGDTSYIVEVDTDSLFTGALLKGATVTGTSHAFAAGDLLPNTSHWFRIRAKDRLGFQYANQNFSGTHVTEAATPTNGSVTSIALTSATFSWNRNSNPLDTAYIFEVSQDNFSSFTAQTATFTPTGSPVATHTVTGLSQNTTYYFRVRAKNRENPAVHTPNLVLGSSVTLAAAPTGGLVQGGTVFVSSAVVQWNTNGNPRTAPNVTKYVVEITTDTNGLFSNFISQAATVYATVEPATHTFTTLVPNTSHYFRVFAVNHDDLRSLAHEFTNDPALTWARPPANPSIDGVFVTSATLRWEQADNPIPTDYILEASNISDTGAWVSSRTVTSVGPGDLTGTLRNLTPDTSYYFRVRARNKANVETADVLFSNPQVTWAATPTSATVNAVYLSTAQVSWTTNGNPLGQTRYELEVATHSNFSFINTMGSLQPTVSPATHTMNGISPNRAHYFRVRAVNRQGVSTDYYSNFTGNGTISLAAAPISGAILVSSITNATLEWSSNGNPDGTDYVVEATTEPTGKFLGEGGFNTSASTPTNLSGDPVSFTLSNLVPNRRTYYRVRAKNDDGVPTSTHSIGDEVTLAQNPSYDILGGDIRNATPTSAEIYWAHGPLGQPANPVGLTEYELQISTESTGNFLFVTSTVTFTPTVSPASHTATGLQPGTTHHFRVRAKNSQGIFSAYHVIGAAMPPPSTPSLGNYDAVWISSAAIRWDEGLNSPDTVYIVQTTTHPSANYDGLGGFVTASSTVSPENVDPATHTMTGLWPNRVHHFRVRARNGAGVYSAWHDFAQTTTTLAAVPNAGTVTQTNISSAAVQWGHNNNPTNTTYVLHASSDSTGGFGFVSVSNTLTPSVSPASHTLTGLLPNTSYYFRVKARNLDGYDSEFHAFGPIITLATVPAAGSTTQIFVTSGTVQWSRNGNPLGRTSYILEASPSLTFSPIVHGATVTNAGSEPVIYNIPSGSLAPNTTHYFRVRAKNMNEIQTNNHVFALGALTWAALPTGGLVDAMYISSATLRWNANGNPDGTSYILEATTATGGNFNAFVTSSSTQTLSGDPVVADLNGLVPNRTTYFRVRAKNKAGVLTDYHSIGSSVTLAIPPVSPAFSAVAETAIGLSWNENGNPADTEYFAEIDTDAAFNPVLDDSGWVDFSIASHAFTGLTPNTTHYLRVRARNRDLTETESTVAIATATLANVPAGVYPGVEAVYVTSATVAWGANSNPSGTQYLVQATSAPGGDFNQFVTTAAVVTTTSATLAGLSANASHVFRVAAINHNNVQTNFFTIASSNTLAAVPVITAFSGMSQTGMTLNWAANGNAAGTQYVAERSAADNASSWPPDAGTEQKAPSAVTSAAFTTLQFNTTYYFRVRAYNADGVPTDYSTAVGTMTLANPVTDGSITDIHATSAAFTWTDPLNPDGRTFYRVDVSTRSDFAPVASSATVTDPSLAAAVASLQSNTTHYARVTALNGRGAPSAAFAFNGGSGFATDPLAPTVAFIQPGVSTGAFALTWNDLNPAVSQTRFEIQVDTSTAFASPDVVTTTTGTGKTVTNLFANATYYARIRAVGHSGVYSNYFTLADSTVTKPNAPAFPYFTNVGVSSFTVNWTANGNAVGTRFWVTVNDDNGVPATTPIDQTTTTALSATFTGLDANLYYYVNIQTVENGQWNTPAADITVSTRISTLANIPGLLPPPFTSVGVTTIGTQWSANGNVGGTQYRVQGSSSPVPFSFISYSAQGTATTDSAAGLLPNTTYQFRVAALNNEGTPTEYLVLGTTVTLAANPVPGAFGIAPTAVTVNWTSTNPSDTIYVASNTTENRGSGTIIANSWISTGLSTNTAYSFQVKAINHAGNSTSFVNFGTVYTAAAVPPAAEALGFSSTTIGVRLFPGTNPSGTKLAMRVVNLQTGATFYASAPVAGNSTLVGAAVWLDHSGWNGSAGINLTGLTSHPQGYRISVAARNEDLVETAYGPSIDQNTVSGPPVIVLPGRVSGDWINTSVVSFTVKNSFHVHYNFVQDLGNTGVSVSTNNVGWSGTIASGYAYHDQNVDIDYRNPLAGFRVTQPGRYILKVIGDAYDASYINNHETNVLQSTSTPFIIHIDLVAPEVNVLGKYSATDPTPIVSRQGTGRRTPYFYWTNPHPVANNLAGVSAIAGFSVSFSTDPGVVPAFTVDPTIPLDTPHVAYPASAVPAGGTYYFKVRALDAAGNWSDPPAVFEYIFEPDITPPKIDRVRAGPNIILPQNNIHLAVPLDSPLYVEFNEAMNATSLSQTDAVVLTAVRDNMGRPVELSIPVQVTYDEASRTAQVRANEQLPAGHRFVLRTTRKALDLGDNPLEAAVEKTFYTVMNPATSNVMLSENQETRLHFAPGAWGDQWLTPAVNEDPEQTPMAAAPSVLRNLIQSANTVARRSRGAFAQPINLEELNLYDGDGTRVPGRFKADVRLTMSYPDADNDGIVDGTSPPVREEALSLSWLEEDTGVWVRVPGSSVDRANNTVSASVSHFSVYGIIGAPHLDLSNAYAYPVPFKPSLGHREIVFINLSSLATIRIFTISGELVKELNETDADGILRWDVTNSEGQPLASDVYLYLIENDQQKKTGKLIIVR